MEKIYDITLFGATGFTGKLTAEYLANKAAKEGFRFAIAGRNQVRLKQIQKELESKFHGLTISLVYADSYRADTLFEMACKSKIIISTVGPYLKYGDPLVKACIDGGANYLDITGEGQFVENMFRLYHKRAKESKLKIINCCGYDSIPSDMGVYFGMKEFFEPTTVEVECFIRVESKSNDPFASLKSFSGGTWHSAIGMMQPSEIERRENFLSYIASTAKEDRKISQIPFQFRYRENQNWIGVPLPFVDVEVVLRSAAGLENYGKDFSYGHYAAISNVSSLLLGFLGVSSIFTLAQFELGRNILLSLKSSGDGPPKEIRDTNEFTHSILVKTNKGNALVEVSGGDPGYGDTAKMVSESAICLLLDSTPENYGVVTSALGLGEPLIKRLTQAGIRFQRL